ncbi:hypothetical protein ABBQ38_004804 [Trebouxia sp. C0009 RCD-2024]
MGVAVAIGHAYFPARQDNWSESWRVYELDLDTWEPRLLPYYAEAPPCWVRGNPAVFEGKWLLCESYESNTSPIGLQSIYVFDFTTLSWSRDAFTGDRFQPRHRGMLAQHDGALCAWQEYARSLAQLGLLHWSAAYRRFGFAHSRIVCVLPC